MTSSNNDYHFEYISSFGIVGHQRPLTLMHVFAIGMSGHDCAVYKGIVPYNASDNPGSWAEEVRRGGMKVPESDARQLFNLGELKYRM